MKISIRLFLYLLYLFSYLVPRNKKIWVFGDATAKRFTDNSKYLFLYVANNKKNKVRAIWISKRKDVVRALKERGYKAYSKWSLKGIYYALRAKYFITDAYSSGINYWLSGRAKKISLWHGIPLKKIGLDTTKGKESKYFQSKGIKRFIHKLIVPWFFEKQYFIVTSSFFQKMFSSIFQVNKDKVVVAGYPRNDIFFTSFENSDLGLSVLPKINDLKKTGKKLIFYLPTFRDSGGNPLQDADFNFDKLNRFLTLNNAIFITKFHIFTNIKEKSFQSLNSKEFLILPPETDIYPILPYMDMLITDYSSVYFDFLLLNKPIIFFPYDFKKYVSKDRELYFDYDQFTPGPKAYSFNKLLKWIEYFLKGKDNYVRQRQKIKNICFKYIDGKSSKRIFEMLWKQ